MEIAQSNLRHTPLKTISIWLLLFKHKRSFVIQRRIPPRCESRALSTPKELLRIRLQVWKLLKQLRFGLLLKWVHVKRCYRDNPWVRGFRQAHKTQHEEYRRHQLLPSCPASQMAAQARRGAAPQPVPAARPAASARVSQGILPTHFSITLLVPRSAMRLGSELISKQQNVTIAST